MLTVGLLDPSFGTDGSVNLPLASSLPYLPASSQVVGQYVLADGKILEVASATQATTVALGGVVHSPLLLRFNADGTPDVTFGDGGKVQGLTSAGYADNFRVSDSAMQTDGKLLLVGTSGRIPVSGTPRLMAQRVNPDGTLDTNFIYAGPGPGFSDGEGSGVAIAANGKVVIATSTPATGPGGAAGFDPAFIRVNADGSPDPTFGPNHDGKVVLDMFSFGSSVFPFSSLLATQGESVVAAESVRNPVTVTRLDPSGVLDPAFGTGGVASFDGFDIAPSLLAIDPKGRVVLAGGNSFDRASQRDVTPRFAFARLDTTGHPDTTFGSATAPGLAYVSFDSRRASAAAIGFVPGGQILAAGTVGAADMRTDLALTRLNENGTLDASFGPGGTAITPTEIFAGSLLAFDPQARVLEARIGSDAQDRAILVAHRFLTSDVAPPDLTPPSVTSFTQVTSRGRFSSLTLAFSEAMEAMSAGSVGSYRLVSAGHDGKLGTRDDRVIRFRSARYNGTTHAVVLKPASGLPTRSLYQLTAFASDLGDLSGNLLAGQGNGVAGRNYVASFRGVAHAQRTHRS